MSRIASLVLSMILAVSLGWGSVAHAFESGCSEESSIVMVGHFDGDGDQIPADADKAYPHHHAECHGHHVGVPAMASPIAPWMTAHGPLMAWATPQLVLAVVDPELRPPIA